MRCAAVALTLSLLTLPPQLVCSKPKPNKQAKDYEAQAHRAISEKRYKDAAMLFKKAYSEAPKEHSLLYNAARAYQMGAHLNEALSLFRLYLTFATGSDAESKRGRQDALEHIAAIETQLARTARPATPSNAEADKARAEAEKAKAEAAKAQAEAAKAQAEAAKARAEAEAAKAEAARTSATESKEPAPGASTAGADTKATATNPAVAVKTEPPPSAQGPQTPMVSQHMAAHNGDVTVRTTAGYSLLGGGAFLAVLGGVLRWQASSVSDTLDSKHAAEQTSAGVTFYTGATQREVSDLVAKQSGYSSGGLVLVTLGAISAAVGGYLLVFRPSERPAQVTVSPQWSQDTMGWSVRGRF